MPAITRADLLAALAARPPNGSNSVANGLDGSPVAIGRCTIDLGAVPLMLDNGQGIIGESGGTLLLYSGKGAAIRFTGRGRAGPCNRPSVRGIMLASSGGGIGVDADTTRTLDNALIADVVLNCRGGAAIDIPKLADAAYATKLRDVSITGSPTDGRAIRIIGLDTELTGVECVNVHGVGGAPIVDLEGSGSLRNVWIEPYGGASSCLRLAGGGWDVRAAWLENHGPDGCPNVVLVGTQLTGDRLIFIDRTHWLDCRDSIVDVQAVGPDSDPRAIRISGTGGVRTRDGMPPHTVVATPNTG